MLHGHTVMCLQLGTNLAGVRELPPIGLLPNFLVNSRVLQPLRYQTGGTVLVRHQWQCSCHQRNLWSSRDECIRFEL